MEENRIASNKSHYSGPDQGIISSVRLKRRGIGKGLAINVLYSASFIEAKVRKCDDREVDELRCRYLSTSFVLWSASLHSNAIMEYHGRPLGQRTSLTRFTNQPRTFAEPLLTCRKLNSESKSTKPTQ